jgi:hypothetical protein
LRLLNPMGGFRRSGAARVKRTGPTRGRWPLTERAPVAGARKTGAPIQ